MSQLRMVKLGRCQEQRLTQQKVLGQPFESSHQAFCISTYDSPSSRNLQGHSTENRTTGVVCLRTAHTQQKLQTKETLDELQPSRA